MWKLFYDTTAMEFRANEKQRRQIMPIRYRRHVTEMQEQSYSDGNDGSGKSTALVLPSS